jgi:hypothetical protein
MPHLFPNIGSAIVLLLHFTPFDPSKIPSSINEMRRKDILENH